MLTHDPATAPSEPVMAGLRASAAHRLPFSRSLEVRAFLLERPAGDVLVYNAPGAGAFAGASLQLLNHWHEAAFGGAPAGPPVLVHEAEVPELPDGWTAARTIRERTRLDADLEAVPIPGHTAGATAFLWDSGRQRFLFTGDSVFLRGDEWVAAVLGSSDRAAYLESLDVLRRLDFDVLVPWAATRGRSPVAVTDRADARRRLTALIDRIRRGEDR